MSVHLLAALVLALAMGCLAAHAAHSNVGEAVNYRSNLIFLIRLVGLAMLASAYKWVAS